MKKQWYERKKYISFKPSTPKEWGHRVWDRFQEEMSRRGYDNSMGDHNYLIGMILMELVTDYTDEADKYAIALIEQRIKNRLDAWEEENK